MKDKYDISRLRILEFYPGELEPALRSKFTAWKNKTNAFPVSTCALHIWVGEEESFKQLPEDIGSREKFKVWMGTDAYVRLVSFAAGISPKTPGKLDDHNRKLFVDSLEQVTLKNPEKIFSRGDLVSRVLSDRKFLGKKGLNRFESLSATRVARKRTGHKKDDRIVIIPSTDVNSTLSGITRDIFSITAAEPRHAASEILVVIPEIYDFDAVRDNFHETAAYLKATQKIAFSSNLHELATAMSAHDSIFACSSRRDTPEVFSMLRDNWRAHASVRKRQPQLACFADSGRSHPTSDLQGLDGVITRRDIEHEIEERRSQNIALADQACGALHEKTNEFMSLQHA